jgi:hypothetical protein
MYEQLNFSISLRLLLGSVDTDMQLIHCRKLQCISRYRPREGQLES